MRYLLNSAPNLSPLGFGPTPPECSLPVLTPLYSSMLSFVAILRQVVTKPLNVAQSETRFMSDLP